MELLHEVISEIMGDDTGLDLSVSPAVIMVIGVNGAGKTTTIGKGLEDEEVRIEYEENSFYH